MRQSIIAMWLDISERTVRRYVQAGCPIDNMDAVATWIRANIYPDGRARVFRALDAALWVEDDN